MTIADQTASITHTGNGTATTFSVPFKFLLNSDVSVVLRNLTTLEETALNSSQYTLTGAGVNEGGTLVYSPAMTNNYQLIISRAMPLEQTLDLEQEGNLPLESIEGQFDKLVMMIQQIKATGGSGSGSSGSGGGLQGPPGATGPAGPSNYIPPTATIPGSMYIPEATNNGSNNVNLIAPTALAADANVTLPSVTGSIISTAESKNLSAGFTSTAFSNGTKTSGTFTPDPAYGNLQSVTNGGAHTLNAPSVGTGDSLSMVLLYTNNASAGTITFSGFTKVNGSADTANTNKFMFFITIIAGFSYLSIVAMQ